MSRYTSSIPQSYFDALYADDPDPWRFAASDYERDKYAATLKASPREHYASALEIGCSIGVFTRQLASRCDSLLGIDVATAALEQAKRRCADRPAVRFMSANVPGQWPEGRFDLIILSEVVYYLDEDDVDRLASRVAASVTETADIILVHWLGETHYPLTGDQAADLFIDKSANFTRVINQSRTGEYRLDVLRTAGPSTS